MDRGESEMCVEKTHTHTLDSTDFVCIYAKNGFRRITLLVGLTNEIPTKID